ncbi:DUF6310 domain-containing protein [Corallococcus terminator]
MAGLDAYERNASRERAGPTTRTLPSLEQEPSANGEPTQRGQGRDWFPPTSSDTAEHHPGCEPVPVPHAGEDDPHNECADRVPPNRYPGMDVLVGGKRFDALQVGARVLWEIKTHRFETYTEFLRNQVAEDQAEEFQESRAIAVACGYDFIVGVSGAAHREALLREDFTLKIVVTGCNR